MSKIKVGGDLVLEGVEVILRRHVEEVGLVLVAVIAVGPHCVPGPRLDTVPVATKDDIARVCHADIEAVMLRFRAPSPARIPRRRYDNGCLLVLRHL